MQSNYINFMHEDRQRKVLLCQPKTVLVTAQFNALQNVYGGFAILETRLDNIVAYRVKYFNISINNADWNPHLNGSLFTLRSSSLGSNVNGGNHFISGESTGGGLLQRALGDSTIIGWAGIGSSGIGGQTTAMQQLCNHLQPLSRPLCIERFDWTVAPLLKPLAPINHTYTIEFAIEFYSPCQCQVRYDNSYGSL